MCVINANRFAALPRALVNGSVEAMRLLRPTARSAQHVFAECPPHSTDIVLLCGWRALPWANYR